MFWTNKAEKEINNRIKININYIKSFGFETYSCNEDYQLRYNLSECIFCKKYPYRCYVNITPKIKVSPAGEKFYENREYIFYFCPRCDWARWNATLEENVLSISDFIKSEVLNLPDIILKDKPISFKEIKQNIEIMEEVIVKNNYQLEKYKDMLKTKQPYR